MNELKAMAAGVVGGAAVGRILGIGPVGTVMGALAGAFLGYVLASPAESATWADVVPDGPL